MLQEIITYLIIVSATILAVLKIAKRFRKKKKSAKHNYRKDKISMNHNCSECSTDCALRDLPKQIIESSSEVCKKDTTRLDQF